VTELAIFTGQATGGSCLRLVNPPRVRDRSGFLGGGLPVL